MAEDYAQFLDPQKLEEDSNFYKKRLYELFGNKVTQNFVPEIPGGREPIAYDRRFKTPIVVDRLKTRTRDRSHGPYKVLENTFASFNTQPLDYLDKDPKHRQFITLNPSVARSWQQGEPFGTDTARHEIIHAFQTEAAKRQNEKRGVAYEPKGNTASFEMLVNLLNWLQGNKEPELAPVLRKIYNMEKEGTGFGDVKRYPATGELQFKADSHWPGISKGSYDSQYGKFNDAEIKVLKKFFADEAQRLGYGKYKSLWE